MTIFHKIAHLFNVNYGVPDCFYKDGKLMMSFLCSGCGSRDGIYAIADDSDVYYYRGVEK